MTPQITVALFSFLGTCVGTLGGILAANRLTNYRIAQLEKKVEQHNSVVERITVVEVKLDEHQQDQLSGKGEFSDRHGGKAIEAHRTACHKQCIDKRQSALGKHARQQQQSGTGQYQSGKRYQQKQLTFAGNVYFHLTMLL